MLAAMQETRRRWVVRPSVTEWSPRAPVSLAILIETTARQEPYRTLLENAQRHEILWRALESEHLAETILLFEHDAPAHVRQALEAACLCDPAHFYSYKLLVDHRLGENATLLIQQSNPRPGFAGPPPAMETWVRQMEQVAGAQRVTDCDWYTLHVVCSIAGGMPYLHNFRTVEALDAHHADLWRTPSAEPAMQPISRDGTPLQYDMFSGAWVDNRTRRQKKHDRIRRQPRQIEMFSPREVAQFGVDPHPLLPLSPHTKLGLIFEDTRTNEEKERDLQRAAEERTYRMFGATEAQSAPPPQAKQPSAAPIPRTLALVLYEAPCLALTVVHASANASFAPCENLR